MIFNKNKKLSEENSALKERISKLESENSALKEKVLASEREKALQEQKGVAQVDAILNEAKQRAKELEEDALNKYRLELLRLRAFIEKWIGALPEPKERTAESKKRMALALALSEILNDNDCPITLEDGIEILEKLKAKGVNIGYVTLHVGLGTFRPVKADKIEDHHMHSEHYQLPKETADLINKTKAEGGRVIAVGTTSCRTLESAATFCGEIREDDRNTDIFIYPGYKFKCIDGLLTNFHLPESTLIMLVSAFYGYDKTMSAYKEAVDEKYRFFSFGDCMLII